MAGCSRIVIDGFHQLPPFPSPGSEIRATACGATLANAAAEATAGTVQVIETVPPVGANLGRSSRAANDVDAAMAVTVTDAVSAAVSMVRVGQFFNVLPQVMNVPCHLS